MKGQIRPHGEARPENLPGKGILSRQDETGDAYIEDYLDHLYAPLVGTVPYEARQELRAEVRSHLLAYIAAYEELGSGRDAAVRAALTQLGDPGAIARQWLRSWERAAPVSSARPAAVLASAVFGVSAALTAVLVSVVPWLGVALAPQLAVTIAVTTPLVAGLLVGLLTRGRPAMGVFYALSLLIAAGGGLFWLLPEPISDPVAKATIFASAFWMPVGCAAAALGGWLQTRVVRPRRRWALPG